MTSNDILDARKLGRPLFIVIAKTCDSTPGLSVCILGTSSMTSGFVSKTIHVRTPYVHHWSFYTKFSLKQKAHNVIRRFRDTRAILFFLFQRAAAARSLVRSLLFPSPSWRRPAAPAAGWLLLFARPPRQQRHFSIQRPWRALAARTRTGLLRRCSPFATVAAWASRPGKRLRRALGAAAVFLLVAGLSLRRRFFFLEPGLPPFSSCCS